MSVFSAFIIIVVVALFALHCYLAIRLSSLPQVCEINSFIYSLFAAVMANKDLYIRLTRTYKQFAFKCDNCWLDNGFEVQAESWRKEEERFASPCKMFCECRS